MSCQATHNEAWSHASYCLLLEMLAGYGRFYSRANLAKLKAFKKQEFTHVQQTFWILVTKPLIDSRPWAWPSVDWDQQSFQLHFCSAVGYVGPISVIHLPLQERKGKKESNIITWLCIFVKGLIHSCNAIKKNGKVKELLNENENWDSRLPWREESEIV